jgi:hydroxymethylpyrimidine kinase/phosphomethylpyrimidine kinase
MKKNVLTIAGLDPSGCAGISADLKTFQAFDVHGLAVVTTITAQNTAGVDGVFAVAPEVIQAQFDSIVSDIEVHAVKIGLLPDADTLRLIADLCRELTNIVVDPILASTTGYQFANEVLMEAYKQSLFPIADVITPNMDEATALSGSKSMKEAAAILQKSGPGNVVITGGDLHAMDLLYDGSEYFEFPGTKISTEDNRGTGCTFSATLAACLAKGENLQTAIVAAKDYISRGLMKSYKVGRGRGTLDAG